MYNIKFEKETFIREVRALSRLLYAKDVEECSKQELFQTVALVAKDVIIDDWMETARITKRDDPKIVYYMSMEFLMGRSLGNSLCNMQAFREVAAALEELGVDLNALEDQEPDAALGNGGLGRLAACFLESLTTLGYPVYGCGIRYHYGMFRQKIVDGYQKEVPDNWLKNGNPFELKRPEYAQEIKFGGRVRIDYDPETGRNYFDQEDYSSVRAVPYDIPVVGNGNHIVNTLRVWDAEAISDFHLGDFDKGDYQKAMEQENLARNIANVLYPNDNHEAGKELRLKQQYFFVSASLQTAVAQFKKKHSDLHEFPDKVAIQMNDTHPTVAVAELMRILLDQEHMQWDEAWDITTRTCAYTNHTIMQEALEKWPIGLFSRLLPRIYMIVEEINRRLLAEIASRYPGDTARADRMAILHDGQVKMAFLAIYGSHSVNGVAALHTQILKSRELRDFYEMMPEKFSNKTNGVTQRRFLVHGNPLLSDWISGHIGSDWINDFSQISRLKDYVDDPAEQKAFMEIKRQNKLRLAAYIQEHNGITIDPDSIYDIQVKRLHEYKRQLLNILHVMYLYNKIKDHPEMPFVPRTFIFGAKAAAGYRVAKTTIKLINAVADKINNDETIKGKLKVVFIEEYNVSKAELLVAAADVSEQISTASKEASGTGNMKFMMNGAVTIGTLDGANVEIAEEVGEDNIFLFGMHSDEVIRLERDGGYDPVELFNNDPDIRRVLLQLVNGEYSPNREEFREIYDSLLTSNVRPQADTFFILKDFRSYAEAQERVEATYRDRSAWARMAMMQTASSGKFTSDRTVQEYVDEIWHLEKYQTK